MDEIIKVSDLTLKQRIDVIKMFALSSNIDVLKTEKSDVNRFVRFVFDFEHKVTEFHILAKNIVNSGWKDKPYVKRIQIPPLNHEEMHKNEKNVFSCLLGVVYCDNKPLIVVWNPFRFTFHKTNRSCYVFDSSLIDTVKNKNGFYRTIDSEKEIIICDQNNFDKLLKEYIKRNGLDE